MSEIRSQATPARDSGLTDALRDAVGDNYDHGRNPNLTGQLWHEDGIRDSIDWAGAARDLEREGWSKRRTANAPSEFEALPVGSVVLLTSRRAGHVAWQKQEGDRWCEASNWECSMTSLELWAVNLPATVLFTPGDAG